VLLVWEPQTAQTRVTLCGAPKLDFTPAASYRLLRGVSFIKRKKLAHLPQREQAFGLDLVSDLSCIGPSLRKVRTMWRHEHIEGFGRFGIPKRLLAKIDCYHSTFSAMLVA
jgi:hypothetical protein